MTPADVDLRRQLRELSEANQAYAKRLSEALRPLFSHAEFKLLMMALHPDARPSAEQRNDAMALLLSQRQRLEAPAPSPLMGRPLPASVADLMTAKAAARAARAKRRERAAE